MYPLHDEMGILLDSARTTSTKLGFVTGDGEWFPSLELAKQHAQEVLEQTNVVISLEEVQNPDD